ncbi:DUF4349 domain-containing protein [Dyella silvatica]|uniref:DUF4349 domain-containing protein n=1 Tax=Dyella silvatica TaxID=2992128 RepID=UPI00225718B9|nr:DUF4349 domain-containing protein [Dyella silvatica]
MRTAMKHLLLLLMLASPLLGGCAKKQESHAQASISGEQAKAGAQLAYEHRLTLLLPPATIEPRLAATREACESARFGDCNVIRIEQSADRASISLRIVPTGVEPLVSLAAQGGNVGTRETTAEDLGNAVADNRRQQAQLKYQQQRLSELAARKDISVTDLIALSREQATVENNLQELELAAAGQQRRITTNLVTLTLLPTGSETRYSRLGTSWSGMLDELTEGTGNALNTLSYGLPFLILGFPLLLLWIWLWRKVIKRRN